MNDLSDINIGVEEVKRNRGEIEIKMKLETSKKEELEEVIELLNSTEIGELYFGNNIEKIGFAVRREHEKNCILIARNENNSIIGTLIHDINGTFGKYPYIHMLAVSPAFQNQGIGTSMLELYEKEHLKTGDKIFLLVAECNKGAKRLYERMGYKELGGIDGFYKKDQIEILMIKSI